MPAYFDTGFCVRQPSWHRLENLLSEYPENWDEARMAAGLMWEPVVASTLMTDEPGNWSDVYVPMIIERGQDVPEGGVFIRDASRDGARVFIVPAENRQAILRDDTKAILATPTDTFSLITHGQMGELIEAYTEQWRKAGAAVKFETAGSLRGGAMVWCLVYLDEPYTIPGDDSESYPFAALTNYHDGTGACRLMPTQVRIVCWNTWKAAEYGEAARGAGIVLRHSGDVSARLDDAKASLATMRDDAKAWQMTATDLAGLNIDDAVVRTFLDEFIPIPENASDRTRNSRAERQATFMGMYQSSPTCAPLPDTAYKLVQCAGEYLDHMRPFRSADTYLARTMFTPEPIKAGVVTLVRELATAGVN